MRRCVDLLLDLERNVLLEHVAERRGMTFLGVEGEFGFFDWDRLAKAYGVGWPKG
jgi:hypothetical protein